MPSFLDVRPAAGKDVAGFGDDLSTETLLWAYRHGIFPWPMAQMPLLWFCPCRRAILDFTQLHIPRRLARARRTSEWTFTINHAFDAVITGCQTASRPGQSGTWITPDIVAAYKRLHHAGHAHSVEAWDSSGQLAGGIYGVDVDGAFAGESMFYNIPNASKMALLYLIDHLQSQGLDWIDIQMMTPHMEALGATLIPRHAFLARLEITRSRCLNLFPKR